MRRLYAMFLLHTEEARSETRVSDLALSRVVR